MIRKSNWVIVEKIFITYNGKLILKMMNLFEETKKEETKKKKQKI